MGWNGLRMPKDHDLSVLTMKIVKLVASGRSLQHLSAYQQSHDIAGDVSSVQQHVI